MKKCSYAPGPCHVHVIVSCESQMMSQHYKQTTGSCFHWDSFWTLKKQFKGLFMPRNKITLELD